MTRLMMPLMFCALACALVCAPVKAEDPPKKLTVEEHKELEKKGGELNATGAKAYQAGKYAEATKAFEDALKIARKIYNKVEFPDGHVNLALSLDNLGLLYQMQGKLAEAELLLKETLATREKMFKGAHPLVAQSLHNLGIVYQAQGKMTDAELLFQQALEMREELHLKLLKSTLRDKAESLNSLATLYVSQGRYADAEKLLKNSHAIIEQLCKGDHPDMAASLNNMGLLYKVQGKLSDAEQFLKDTLEMRERLFKGDHPDKVQSLLNLAVLYMEQNKLVEAEPLCKKAMEINERMFKGDHPVLASGRYNLAMIYQAQKKFANAESLFKSAMEMRRRLFTGDHPDVAQSLHSLAGVALDQGKLAEAESLSKDALEMRNRLFKGDHLDVALNLYCLALVYQIQRKSAEAEAISRAALDMNKRLTAGYAARKLEGEALTFASALQPALTVHLSVARLRAADSPDIPATAYSAVWLAKGHVARVFEQRHLRSRVAAIPDVTKKLDELAVVRRRRAELLLAPATNDATRKQRETDLKAYDATIDQLAGELTNKLPSIARLEKLNSATPADLRTAFPTDATLVDYFRYTFVEWDVTRPAGEQVKNTDRYLAFVVTKDKVTWVDLDTAANIEPAITAWRDAITGGKEIPAAMPAKVRELVWEKVRKELPANIKTVYICPDAALCRVPFAALPGDKPGTVLLEDFALATIPHAPFLLDKLWPQDKPTSTPSGALVVGGVKYDADVAKTAAGASRGDPLVKPDAKLAWGALPGTVGELNGVSATAARKKIGTTRIEGEKATPAAILAALPKAKYAHLATHGFFADASFRGIFQLDPKDYEMRGGERIGRAVNSPLVMTGLVFAGANNPKTPGRGIVTGEQLIDLDLSGLELAVLSACETGLGDVAGGEGTFGLQRAFHYAGTTNVVASLWKVPDAPTAALMNLFYTNLWDKNLAPMEALRQAQLELYKNPQKIAKLAEGFRGKFEEVQGAVEVKPTADGKAHTLLWAAFTLSGPGR